MYSEYFDLVLLLFNLHNRHGHGRKNHQGVDESPLCGRMSDTSPDMMLLKDPHRRQCYGSRR